MFSDADIIARQRLMEVQYKSHLIEESIKKAGFTYDAEVALINVVTGLFDINNILAKTRDPEYAIIDAQIALNDAWATFMDSDANNPQINNIMTMTLNEYALFMTRADGTEREWQGRGTINQSTVEYGPRQPQQAPSRGWRRFLPGGGGR
jgi:hypothetical protein